MKTQTVEQIDTVLAESVDAAFWEPEEVVIHSRPTSAEGCAWWGVAPDEAFCGFIYTAENRVGSPTGLQGDSRFIATECGTCKRIYEMAQRAWAAINA